LDLLVDIIKFCNFKTNKTSVYIYIYIYIYENNRVKTSKLEFNLPFHLKYGVKIF
jgi:hypothetical protein